MKEVCTYIKFGTNPLPPLSHSSSPIQLWWWLYTPRACRPSRSTVALVSLGWSSNSSSRVTYFVPCTSLKTLRPFASLPLATVEAAE